MILLMMFLKCLTSKHAYRGLCVMLSMSLLTGCGSKKILVRSQSGYVNVTALAQRLPGWSQVAEYDRLLAKSGGATGLEKPLPSPDPSLMVLSALALQSLPMPTIAHQLDRRQLMQAAQVRMQAFALRRASARQSEIEQARPSWEQEAQRQYLADLRTARLAYAESLERRALAQEVARVNLRLQESALVHLISAWQSSTPPTPRLDKARVQLAEVQKKIADAQLANRLARQQAQTALSLALSQAAMTRDAYVNDHVGQLTAKLLVQDMRETDLQEERLQTQINTLLQEESAALTEAEPRTGTLASLKLNSSVGAAPLVPKTEAQNAVVRLQKQRIRWIAYLQDEAMAKAQEVARIHRWTLNFRREPGLPDFTSQVAQELSRD